MSDVTAHGAAPHRPRASIVPSWHHVHDDGEQPGAGPAPDRGGDETPTGQPVPEPTVSLAPSRQPAMWLVLLGVGLATAVALLIDARAASLVLSGVLAVAGVCRAVIPGPGPVGITVRSRGLDTFFFLAPAVVIAFLAFAPGVKPG
ncbi:DUF3017 domain-containing protein [Cellulosimicrobium sp. PMB13]|uniref:DUF3017 domain-containing protein n=1 Tax=Cellulosimicrobium sp. PMB13 TaxID=3120158 RepID=UPI003F4C3D62